MSPEIWRFLCKHKYAPGTQITTTLLGKVIPEHKNYRITTGNGYIPPELQDEAETNGFRIIHADWRNNFYTLQVIR